MLISIIGYHCLHEQESLPSLLRVPVGYRNRFEREFTIEQKINSDLMED